jgi:hypothetical protein
VEIDHIPTSAFRSLIKFDDKSHLQILQKFIIPKGQQNSVLKCHWQDGTLLIEKRTNLNFLTENGGEMNYNIHGGDVMPNPYSSQIFMNDKELELNEKVATFEGDPNFSVDEKVFATNVHERIRKAIQVIYTHFEQQDITLVRAVFYFKFDKANHLYLLFATNIK